MKSIFLLILAIAPGGSFTGQTLRLEDQSDWWSLCNEKELSLNIKLVDKRFDTSNFKILGWSLETLDFGKVATKLGKAPIVSRGYASYSRSQACYVSNSDSDKIYLIFESGEGLSSTFYIFRGGPNWKGSSLCVRSDQVSSDLATGTGLRLGLSRAEVEAILGRPDSAAGNRIAYCREFKRKATREEFERLRHEDPNLTDERAHELYDFIEESIQIQANFTDQKLSYFFVSTSSQS